MVAVEAGWKALDPGLPIRLLYIVLFQDTVLQNLRKDTICWPRELRNFTFPCFGFDQNYIFKHI